MKKPGPAIKVLGFGAVLWDEIDGCLNIGGAVFNLIAHLKTLGAECYFITAVGSDEPGDRVYSFMHARGIHTDFVGRLDTPTCVVRVSVDESGAPIYSIPDFTSWDRIHLHRDDITKMNTIGFDYFCFGTLEQRNKPSRSSLRKILKRCMFKNVMYDMNLRLDYYDRERIEYSMHLCSILKMNEEESGVVNKIFRYAAGNYRVLTEKLRQDFKIDICCITKGAEGAYISSNEGFHFFRGYTVPVVDTVGAGDAFSAGLVYKHGMNASLGEACDFACRLGAFVASRRGAVPEYSIADIGRNL
jgi:fructokinase